MKSALLALLFTALTLCGQEPRKAGTGKPPTDVQLEHFTLTGGRAYDGIWDAAKSQLHVVVKTNHVANVPVMPDEIVTRKSLGDGSDVKILSDLEVTEKVLRLNKQNYMAAQARLQSAKDKRAQLHQFYHGKGLPQKEYDAVQLQYKAADAEVAAAGQALDIAAKGLDKALAAYRKAGGKPGLLD